LQNIDLQAPFTLLPSEIHPDDNLERRYIDDFIDVSEGRQYKGQWLKSSNAKDGVGI
jgi:hypothetical protein